MDDQDCAITNPGQTPPHDGRAGTTVWGAVICATFCTRHGAGATLARLRPATQGGLVDGTNAATLTRTEDGVIVPVRTGMPSGWPGVGGGALIAGILSLLEPAAITLPAGAPALLHVAGFDETDLQALADELRPGTSMLVAVLARPQVAAVEDLLNLVASKLGSAPMTIAMVDLLQHLER